MSTKIDKHHKELLKQIRNVSSLQPFKSKYDSSYDGHNEKTYSISNPQTRKIVKEWVNQNKNLTLKEYVELLNSVYTKGASSTEKYLGGFLIEYLPKLRKDLNPKLLNKWLENLTGWAQVDSLCQSKFGASDMLNNWKAWQETIKSFVVSPNISKSRASLVLLTRPVRESENNAITQLALENIEALKSEKDILITKAISWLLRDMIKLHKTQVERYLKENETTLPKIAVRETTNKLNTGKK